jgi:hypothetical protein
MQHEPFYTRVGDQFSPNEVSAGPWRNRSLMGRVVVGLLGSVIEERHGAPDFIPSRLTVDLHRLPDFSPVEIRTSVVREGGRIRVVQADFVSGGSSAAHAVCQFLKRTENPEGRIWRPADWTAPAPEDVPVGPDAQRFDRWDVRPFAGHIGAVAEKRAWLRDYREIVGGRPLTPFSRVALCADFVSPFSMIGDRGAGFINSDVNLHLHRLPASEWIGFEVVNHQATDGIGLGQVRLYDAQGSIGAATASAVAQSRPPETQFKLAAAAEAE